MVTGDIAAPLHMMSSMLVCSVTVRTLQVFALIVVPTLTDKHVYTHTHTHSASVTHRGFVIQLKGDRGGVLMCDVSSSIQSVFTVKQLLL